MSYIVIPVYDFACDNPGCSAIWECTPANMGTSKLLDKAHELLRAEGWTANRNYEVGAVGYCTWVHYCPEHSH